MWIPTFRVAISAEARIVKTIRLPPNNLRDLMFSVRSVFTVEPSGYRSEIPRCTACLSCRPANININIFLMLTSKLHQYRCFGVNIKIPTDCSKTQLNLSSCSTSHRFTFFTSELLTFSSTYFYHEDKRALPGNVHSRKFVRFPR
jgi:hypothetical protein